MITKREQDIADGYPVADWMTEDPRKGSIPLFLQTQNRRPRSGIDVVRTTPVVVDVNAGRQDFRKPAGMSWEEWDARPESRRVGQRTGEVVRTRAKTAPAMAKASAAGSPRPAAEPPPPAVSDAGNNPLKARERVRSVRRTPRVRSTRRGDAS